MADVAKTKRYFYTGENEMAHNVMTHNVMTKKGTRKTNKVVNALKGHRKVHNNGSDVLELTADSLIVDNSYQRWTSATKIKNISQTFNWNAFGIPTVAPRKDGTYALLDGQNRFLAIIMHFGGLLDEKGNMIVLRVESRPCKTRQEEARIFMEINGNQKNLTKPDFFHAGIISGDKTVRAILNTLHKHGVGISYGQGKKLPNETRCAGVFMDSFVQLMPQKFNLMIEVLAKCYKDDSGHIESTALTAAFLRGLSYYLYNMTETFVEVKRKLKSAKSAAAVMLAAKRDRESLVFSGWKRPQIVAKHIGLKR